jgi:hypothetical protein
MNLRPYTSTYFASKTAALVAPASGSDYGRYTTTDLMAYVDLWAVSFGGELSLTVINYAGLIFSFVHISYLCTVVSARGCVILFFAWLKGREARRNKEIAKRKNETLG